MKFAFRRFLAALLVVFLLPAGALALTGQSITAFEAYYKEDLAYVNDSTGRHMLYKDLTVLDLNDNGRMQYYYYDDTLHITVAADAAGIIESCEIRLLYPKDAEEGNSLYLDFVAASYHSLAFIMAMHASSEVASRYLLGEEIKNALAANYGAYERQYGSYTISCVSVVGEGAVFTFTNTGLAPAPGEPDVQTGPDGTDGQPPADPGTIDDDEAANYG